VRVFDDVDNELIEYPLWRACLRGWNRLGEGHDNFVERSRAFFELSAFQKLRGFLGMDSQVDPDEEQLLGELSGTSEPPEPSYHAAGPARAPQSNVPVVAPPLNRLAAYEERKRQQEATNAAVTRIVNNLNQRAREINRPLGEIFEEAAAKALVLGEAGLLRTAQSSSMAGTSTTARPSTSSRQATKYASLLQEFKDADSAVDWGSSDEEALDTNPATSSVQTAIHSLTVAGPSTVQSSTDESSLSISSPDESTPEKPTTEAAAEEITTEEADEEVTEEATEKAADDASEDADELGLSSSATAGPATAGPSKNARRKAKRRAAAKTKKSE
jgi:hypothetical protein